MGCYVLLTYPVLACPDLRLYSAEHKKMRKMAPTTMIRLIHPTIAHTAIIYTFLKSILYCFRCVQRTANLKDLHA